MWIEERHRRIRGLMHASGQVSVERVTAELGVSRETVRRDLVDLEAQGEIRRVHGGAILAQSELPIDVRAVTRVREKRALAKAAAVLIKSGQTLFIDAGTTTSILAEALCVIRGLHIVTNSVTLANRLAANEPGAANANQVHLLGGQYNPSVSATFGSSTILELNRFQADLALMSPVGIDAEHGATSFVAEEAALARAMSVNARKTIILADYTKVGVRSRIAYCSPKQVSLLITNRKAASLPCAAAMDSSFKRIEYV